VSLDVFVLELVRRLRDPSLASPDGDLYSSSGFMHDSTVYVVVAHVHHVATKCVVDPGCLQSPFAGGRACAVRMSLCFRASHSGNLDKTLEDLGLTDGDEISIVDDSLAEPMLGTVQFTSP
jgi:hypothetical protein